MKSAFPLLLALVCLAGCGGGGGDSPAAAPLSKAEYVRQADDLCTRATTTLQALKPPTDPAGLGAFLTQSVGAAQTATDGLGKLVAPAADAADLKAKFVGPLAAQVEAVKVLIPQYEAAAKAPDPKTALAAIRRPDLARPDAAYVGSYGMAACAQLATGQAAG